MKMQFDVRRWKIKYKLIAAIYMVLIPALAAITLYVYRQSVTTVREELGDAYRALTATIDSNVALMESDMDDLMTYVAINDDIRLVLNADPDSATVKNTLVWKQQTPAEFISEMLHVKSDIQCFALYAANGTTPYINKRRTTVLTTDISRIETLPVLRESEANMGDIVMMRMDAEDRSLIVNNNQDRILFGMTIMSYSKRQILGYLCAVIDTRNVIERFSAERLEKNESIYLYDSKGSEIVHMGEVSQEQQKEIAEKCLRWNGKETILQTRENYLFCSRNKQYGYLVVYVTPKENWNRQLKSAGRVPVIIALALLLATIPVFNLVTRFITRPLQSLHVSMQKLQEGDFKQQVQIYAQDEIGEVTQGYNMMVRRINDLIDKNYVMVLRERESELDLLQAQINPHFLYNTLDSLYWDAFNLGDMELAENIMALSELFRLALSRGKGIVTVEAEFKLIESYLRIQKMRFGERMDYRINLLSDMKDMEIPKLILQPFVENAIVHGLENTSHVGMVNVHGYPENDYMVFKISDNGVGMDENQLRELFAEDKGNYSHQRISKYAIKNVRERLKLRYNDDFELKISSTIQVGTTVIIKIPKQ